MQLNSLGRIVAAAVLCMTGQGSMAQTPVQEDAVFKDWRVRCETQEGGTSCQMLQTASATEGGAAVFLLTISPGEDKGDFAVMTVPLGVYMAHGLELRVDKRRPFKVLFEVCDRSGCHAGFRMSGTVFTAFRQGLDARVRVWTAKTQAVEFPVSLRGFSDAWAHYQAEMAG